MVVPFPFRFEIPFSDTTKVKMSVPRKEGIPLKVLTSTSKTGILTAKDGFSDAGFRYRTTASAVPIRTSRTFRRTLVFAITEFTVLGSTRA